MGGWLVVCLFFVCSLFVLCLFFVCSWFVLGLFFVCSLFVGSLFVGSLLVGLLLISFTTFDPFLFDSCSLSIALHLFPFLFLSPPVLELESVGFRTTYVESKTKEWTQMVIDRVRDWETNRTTLVEDLGKEPPHLQLLDTSRIC